MSPYAAASALLSTYALSSASGSARTPEKYRCTHSCSTDRSCGPSTCGESRRRCGRVLAQMWGAPAQIVAVTASFIWLGEVVRAVEVDQRESKHLTEPLFPKSWLGFHPLRLQT